MKKFTAKHTKGRFVSGRSYSYSSWGEYCDLFKKAKSVGKRRAFDGETYSESRQNRADNLNKYKNKKTGWL